MNYLIDAYTIFAASVLAANAVLRSCFGFAFPLFTTQMYNGLGIHWGSSIPAFLSLACVPFPFLFWKYGPAIRERCKYAREAAEFMKKMQNQQKDSEDDEEDKATSSSSDDHVDKEKENEEEREREDVEQEAFDYSYAQEYNDESRFQEIRTTKSRQSRPSLSGRTKSYDSNPFDLDRTNTRESFRWEARNDQMSRRSSKASKTSRK